MEVSADYEQPSRQEVDGSLWTDKIYDGLRATDGTDISSRAKHREYMRARGLTTMDDYKNEWNNARKARDDFYTGKRGAVTREDVARAIHQLENKRK